MPFFLLRIFISHLSFAKPGARYCEEYKKDAEKVGFHRMTSKFLSLSVLGRGRPLFSLTPASLGISKAVSYSISCWSRTSCLAMYIFSLMEPEVRTGFFLPIWQESTWFYKPIKWTMLSCSPSNSTYYFCLTQCAFEPDRSGLNPSSALTSCVNLGQFLCPSEAWIFHLWNVGKEIQL